MAWEAWVPGPPSGHFGSENRILPPALHATPGQIREEVKPERLWHLAVPTCNLALTVTLCVPLPAALFSPPLPCGGGPQLREELILESWYVYMHVYLRNSCFQRYFKISELLTIHHLG